MCTKTISQKYQVLKNMSLDLQGAMVEAKQDVNWVRNSTKADCKLPNMQAHFDKVLLHHHAEHVAASLEQFCTSVGDVFYTKCIEFATSVQKTNASLLRHQMDYWSKCEKALKLATEILES